MGGETPERVGEFNSPSRARVFEGRLSKMSTSRIRLAAAFLCGSLLVLPAACKQLAGYEAATAALPSADAARDEAGSRDAARDGTLDSAQDSASVLEDGPPLPDGDDPIPPDGWNNPGDSGDALAPLDGFIYLPDFSFGDMFVPSSCIKDTDCTVMACCNPEPSCTAIKPIGRTLCSTGYSCPTACSSLGLVSPDAYCLNGKCRLRDASTCAGASGCVKVDDCCLRCAVMPASVASALPRCNETTCIPQVCSFSPVCGGDSTCRLQ